MDVAHLDLAALIAVGSAGFLLTIAIVTGRWKYHHIHTSADRRAPTYVNVAHQASLAYCFSSLVVAALAELSAWPAWVNVTAVILLLSQFYFATGTYVIHGLDSEMKNQFAFPHRLGKRAVSPNFVHKSMVIVFTSEMAGAAILLAGLAAAVV